MLEPKHPQPGRDPQAAAAEAIAGHAGLVLVVGPAGTGKTTTVARAVTRLRDQRRPVLGLAPSGKAADVLAEEAGCQADDPRRAPHAPPRHARPHGCRPGRRSSSTRPAWPPPTTSPRLVELAEQHGWRLVAVGDPAQLPAVGRGGVFAHWCDTLPHHELTDPRRFTEPWEAARQPRPSPRRPRRCSRLRTTTSGSTPPTRP